MGNRPTDWHVLDLDEDPTPGDPERVKQLARELHDFADDVADALRQIKGMAGEDAILRWAGKTAKAFQDEFEEVPKNLKKLQRSYDLAGDALAAYWPKLERAQSLADKALARGREARNELSSATGRLDSATSWVERATAKTEEYDEKEGKDKPDDSEVRAAVRNATDAKSAQAGAQRAVDSAEAGLEAAKKMAADAKKMREDAASEAKDKLEDASDAGIQNRKWWEKAVDWVKDNWDTIVSICKVIVAVLGIVVLIIGGPLAWVVLAAALVVLTDTLIKYMNGEASLFDVAMAGLDCIPGTKGLTTLGGLASGLRGLTRGGLRGMASGLRRGADDILQRGRQTGGELRAARGEDDFNSAWADEAYDSIRATDDVDAIAANVAEYGFTRDQISQIKSHVFEEEHLLDSYADYGIPPEMARFDSNPRMAEAWLRLREGSAHQEDLTLLRHELYESNYMRETGNPSYREAHQAANASGLTWDSEAAARDGFGFRRGR